MERKNSAVYEMQANEYNAKLANLLKEMPEFLQPEWAKFVKTGTAKKRPPFDEDFWHKRAASILRQIYTRGIVGVNRLKTRYGSKKNRGVRPEKFRRASGKIIRVLLQQAEKAGILEKFNESGKRAGRRLTKQGKELMESVK
jgi:small subunit ribosomal protein S19e